jgi:hypothetical protein
MQLKVFIALVFTTLAAIAPAQVIARPNQPDNNNQGAANPGFEGSVKDRPRIEKTKKN